MVSWLIPLLWVAVGLVVLLAGGELLVRGAAGLAAAARISPLVIGLTVVAFGTSAPELAVSLQSGLGGEGDLAIGNVLGSNIANVLLILGVSAVIAPLIVSSQLVRFDVPLMVAASLVLALMGLDGTLSRGDGLLLVSGLVVYTGWSLWIGRREPPAIQDEFAEAGGAARRSGGRAIAVRLAQLVVGIGLLVLGARLLVSGAVDLARLVGVSELLIGLTIVAVGTSLPELATSVLASLHGERDIAVGNVVGSNLFNILCVLGVTCLLTPGGLAVAREALRFDVPVMLAVAVSCLPVFFTGSRIVRWEGAMFLGFYAAYLTHLVLDARQSSFHDAFSLAMLGFVIPLAAVTLLIGMVRHVRGIGR